jgi:glycosyltransferase involved in cell wall biosynthesis
MITLKTVSNQSAAAFRATAVIVLYGRAPADSPAYVSLLEARAELPAHDGEVSILLWDNSPSPVARLHLPDGIAYHHDPRNPGLAAAYNYALELAERNGSEWLVTLDQDTTVPCDYLASMAATVRIRSEISRVAAIVPQIAVGRKRLSPYYFAANCIPRWYPRGFHGAPRQCVAAFNSGAMIRVKALRQIGGYDLCFPLDQSDTEVFRKLHQYGKLVYIDGAFQLHHEFSMMDLGDRMTVDRYRSALQAESAFWDLHMNWLAGCERTLRLWLRLIRQWLRNEPGELRQITLEFLTARLLLGRRTRLQAWKDSLNESHLRKRGSSGSRPRISVCMAAFNGARFIEAQLHSILPQLAADDEIVIVDDGSQDDTVARVQSMRDSRIRLFAHRSNEGVVATFEDALRCATGDILFLSDDDDLWAPTKVRQTLDAFAAHPDVRVVISKVALIDESGARLPDSRVNRYGRFVPGFWRNILVNHYQGSAMAIRASLLGSVLPFPQRKSFLHDVWIGTRNEATGGKTAFIDEPLLFYRRHAQNVSQTHRFLRQVKVRIELLLSHFAQSHHRPAPASGK